MRIALIDLDGTLSEGYISMDFLEYLYRNGAYDVGVYRNQMTLLDEYKQGLLSYDNWCRQ